MLKDEDKVLIRGSWRLVVPIADTAADLFYRRLFELQPSYRRMFPEDLAKQKRKLVTMLAFVVKSIDWMAAQWQEDVAAEDDLCLVVLAMGRRHHELYRIPDESYDAVGAALLWTLDQGLGQAFTDDVRSAWTRLYGVVAATMKLGASSSKVDLHFGMIA